MATWTDGTGSALLLVPLLHTLQTLGENLQGSIHTMSIVATALSRAIDTLPPDLELVFPSDEPGGEPCSIRFDQASSHLSRLLGVHGDNKLRTGPPLTERQHAVLENALSKIRASSKDISQLLTGSKSGSRVAHVYDGNGMLDDVLRDTAVLRKISDATEQPMIGRTIFVAGQRAVQAQLQRQVDADGPTDTFQQSESLITEHLGCPPDAAADTNADPLVKRWSKHGAVLISGADSAESDNKKWLETGEAAPASERTKGAARRVALELKGDPFVLRLGTNFILAKTLIDEVKEQCQYMEMINPFCTDHEGILRPLSHANADLNAYHTATALCEKRKIPMGVLHSQFLGFEVESLNEIPGWSAILKAPLSNVGLWRAQTDENLSITTRWTAQSEAGIMGIHDESYKTQILLPRYRSLLGLNAPQDQTTSSEEEERIIASLPWAVDSLKVEHYAEKNTAWARDTRGEAVVHNTRNPCNQSIAGVNGTLVDGPEPKHHSYLPVRADHAAISERLRDAEKVGKVFMDSEKPTTHVAICGDEDELMASVQEIVDYLTKVGDNTADQIEHTEKSRVVDEPLARRIQSFIASQESAARGLLTHLGPAPTPDRKWAEDVLEACDSGPIVETVKSVLGGFVS